MELPAEKRSSILGKWLERTLQTYPDQTAHFLRGEKDRFRNPVGYTLRENLRALFDEIAGDMDTARVEPAVDGIVRMRAVQDFTAAQAVAFIFFLRDILREEMEGGGPALWQTRIDETALLAFDVFMKCREEIYEIKARAAGRGIYVPERVRRRKQAEGL